MNHDLKLDKFEGPLDLLLQLVEQEELNISEIALSQVTEQFFSYLDKLEKESPGELADFLIIAARLIYLKSANLLEYALPEEEEEGPSLADQLKLYKQYVEAGKIVNALWEEGRVAYGRVEPPVKAKEFVLPLNARAANLRDSMMELLKRLKPMEPLPKVSIDYSISVKQKIDALRNILRGSKEISFNSLLSSAKNRTEIIVSFLALLELVKEKTVIIKQSNAFEDLMIARN